MNSISPNLNLMIKACEKASKVIIRDFGELENLQVSKKGPKDFVTKTDKRVELILIEELAKSKKNYSFISEETGKILNKNRDIFWIIDPIDGTTNFLHGIPHFAISVALQEEGEIRSGLIFDPIKNEIFYAEKNNGSFFNNNRIRVLSAITENDTIPSVTNIYPSANWAEREIRDMFGIFVDGHPDLRRILTDYGFQGHPLRKDFPLTGHLEVNYDLDEKRVVYNPVNLVQDFRDFDFSSPWGVEVEHKRTNIEREND